ncbi:MAG: hypothetical protein K0S28_504 [Paucimonas sp.]|nr:hypothetical protein [Paucimonas sp.]
MLDEVLDDAEPAGEVLTVLPAVPAVSLVGVVALEEGNELFRCDWSWLLDVALDVPASLEPEEVTDAPLESTLAAVEPEPTPSADAAADTSASGPEAQATSNREHSRAGKVFFMIPPSKIWKVIV